MPPNTTEDLLQEVSHIRTGKVAPVEEHTDEEDEDISECGGNELGFGAGDALFASFVVAPQVVSVWRGTWGIMDLNENIFPYAQSYIMGIVIHVSFALIRSQLLSRSRGAWGKDGKAGRWLRERALSRVYTYIFILSCIMHWRGGWGLLDMLVEALVPDKDDIHRPILIAGLTVIFYLSSTILRSSRNILAPPYFLVTDGKEATYIFTTRFQKKVLLLYLCASLFASTTVSKRYIVLEKKQRKKLFNLIQK